MASSTTSACRFWYRPAAWTPGAHEGIRRLQADRFNLLGVYSDDPSRATATKTRTSSSSTRPSVNSRRRRSGTWRSPPPTCTMAATDPPPCGAALLGSRHGAHPYPRRAAPAPPQAVRVRDRRPRGIPRDADRARRNGDATPARADARLSLISFGEAIRRGDECAASYPLRLAIARSSEAKGPAARRRPKAAGEAYSLYVEPAAEGANEADGPLSSL